jgi:hypothetical protein
MFDSRLNEEVEVRVAGKHLSGVDSASISYSNNATTSKILGSKNGLTTVGAATQQTLSVSRYLIYDDPVLALTGASSTSGSVTYNSEQYEFDSGYLNNYSVNCAVGSVPKVNADFMIIDELVSQSSETSSAESISSIDIPSQGSISISCDNSSTNRVIGFDYSIKAERKPQYSIGQESAVAVELIPPLEYSAQVQIEVDEALPQSAFNFLTNRENKTISFDIDGRGGADIQSLSIPNASLVSESLSASADGALVLNLNYIGHGF